MRLATHLRRSVAEVRQQLRYLHTAGILHYQPRQESPQAMFTTPRLDAAQLPLDQPRLTAARAWPSTKPAAVVQLRWPARAAASSCCSKYFDEADPPRCGVCDTLPGREESPASGA
ncbi:MAG: hypothetical protein WKG07_24520 [Hymenobacter sp.]